MLGKGGRQRDRQWPVGLILAQGRDGVGDRSESVCQTRGQLPTRIGQHHAASGAAHQIYRKIALQRAHMLRQRGMGDIQIPRSLSETFMTGDSLERPKRRK